jgi:hypothetical protein
MRGNAKDIAVADEDRALTASYQLDGRCIQCVEDSL